MPSRRDVVIIGGGHNGLVAAAYLARAGLSVLVCERREIVGGAAVSEQPFGPGYTVTSLSYVVSLLPQDLVTDLSWSGTAITCTRRVLTSRLVPTAGTYGYRMSQASGEPRSLSSPRAMPNAMTPTRRTWPVSAPSSVRC